MSELLKYQDLAKKKGGFLLSTKISKKKLEWKCEEGHIFFLTASKVHRRGKWCTQCGLSNGERETRKILKMLNINFIQEYYLPISSRRRYDFYFEYNNKKYIIEFDGEQHFSFVRKYHKKKENFNNSQIIDRIKTYNAWNSGIHIIRIDYTQINMIYNHIFNAFNQHNLVYFSNDNMYKYIIDYNITKEQFNKFN